MADISITAASVIASANATLVTRVAGATITAGQPLYLDTTDSNKAKPADANASAAAATVFGIAAHASLAGQPIIVITADPALTIGATVAIGDVIILSATAGGIAPVADLASGMYCTVLGIATSTTKINFKPLAAGAAKA